MICLIIITNSHLTQMHVCLKSINQRRIRLENRNMIVVLKKDISKFSYLLTSIIQMNKGR